MSTTAIKLGSLAIKTLAKPIASRIRQQAREHPRFRKLCVAVAQQIHKVDVRLRLGLLQDTAAFIKAEQADREAARAAAKKLQNNAAIYPADLGTVSSNKPVPPPAVFGDPKTHAHHPPEQKVRPRVRPLPEAKAIESGANFISEFFLFAVAGSLILAEQIRSRRKEANRRDVIAERLELLENRTKQDEERLAELELRSHHDEDRILTLEEQNWRLSGGKGVFPGREGLKRERKIVEPTPLWESMSETGTGFWAKLWGYIDGKSGDANEKAPVITQETEATAAPARSPAIIKKTRPTSTPELPASDATTLPK